jgi:hypothetical protein
MPTEHFKSEQAYANYRAYVHAKGIKTHAKRVCIKGKGCHTVKHGKKKSTRKRVAGK